MIVTQAKDIIIGGSEDVYFINNSLLLQLDTNLSDSSFNSFSLSGYGTTNTVGISGALFGGSTSDYIEAPLDSAFDFGTGDFTIELWAYPTKTTFGTCIARWSSGANNAFFIGISTTGGISVYINDTTPAKITGGTIATNQWQHIALTRQGASVKAFINGVQAGSTFNIGNAAINSSTNKLRIGYDHFGNAPFQGYMDDIRITKGVCRYSSSFSVPTRPFPVSPPIAKKVYLSSNLVYVGKGVTDNDAMTYIAAVETTDGRSLESSTKIAINDFVMGCKADGIWTAIKSCCILAGARTYLGALVPLKGTAPTASTNLLNQSLYSRSTGFQGGGTAQARWINSNRLNNDDPQNDCHAAIHSSIIDGGAALGSNNTLVGEIIIRPYNSNNSLFRAHDNAPTVVAATSIGFSGVSRNVLNLMQYINPNIGLTSVSTASNSNNPNNAPNNIHVFRRNNDLSPSYYGGKISFYSIGTYLDLNLLKARVDALMAAFATL